MENQDEIREYLSNIIKLCENSLEELESVSDYTTLIDNFNKIDENLRKLKLYSIFDSHLEEKIQD
ncbi:MAG TPA: hypothetical protein VGK06_08395 [Methanosarcina sp.]|jgi:hypothetical protein